MRKAMMFPSPRVRTYDVGDGPTADLQSPMALGSESCQNPIFAVFQPLAT